MPKITLKINRSTARIFMHPDSCITGLTLSGWHTILARIHLKTCHQVMDEQQISVLEQKVDELIRLCELLNNENNALKSRLSNWSMERSRLVEKNEIARVKIESMIARLKSLEQNV